MKIVLVLISILSLGAAFAPQQCVRKTTEVKALFDDIFSMDLFSPVADQNNYGARNNKNIKTGQVGQGSYVPAGLTLSQYQKIRDGDAQKKAAKYQKNAAKAGKFLGFDQFYEKRGTAEGGSWLKAPGRGHTFAKTKYDYSGSQDETKGWGDAVGNVFGKK